MEHLFLARHGEYDFAEEGSDQLYCLAEKGKQDIDALSGLMRGITSSEFYVLASPEEVAFESARRIAEHLGAGLEACPILFPEDCDVGERYFGWVYEEIDKHRERLALVLVTHHELAKDFTSALAQRELKTTLDNIESLDMGQAVHYDLERRTCQMLKP